MKRWFNQLLLRTTSALVELGLYYATVSKPDLIAIDHDNYPASHVDRLSDGRQFYLTPPFVRAVAGNAGREFVSLYLSNKVRSIALIALLCFASRLNASPRSDLSSTNQATRDAAAKILRETYTSPPRTNWDSLVASLKVGMSKTNILQLLKPVISRPPSGAGSGSFETEQFRLDDLWVLECHFDHGFIGCKLFPQTFEVWIEPPAHFTGLWTAYYVNGQRSHEIRYKDGKRDGEMTSFYDDGSKAVVTRSIEGITEGSETGYFRSGKTNYTGAYKAGEMIGTWRWFNEDGTIKSTQQHPAR